MEVEDGAHSGKNWFVWVPYPQPCFEGPHSVSSSGLIQAGNRLLLPKSNILISSESTIQSRPQPEIGLKTKEDMNHPTSGRSLTLQRGRCGGVGSRQHIMHIPGQAGGGHSWGFSREVVHEPCAGVI